MRENKIIQANDLKNKELKKEKNNFEIKIKDMEDIINQITNEKEYKENELKKLEKEQKECIIKSNKEKNDFQNKIKNMENTINQIINEKNSKENELKNLEKEKIF